MANIFNTIGIFGYNTAYKETAWLGYYALNGGEDMLSVKGETIFVGVSELRAGIDEILKKAREHKVVIEKRHKPVAALVEITKYEEMENLLEALEDVALGCLARERDRGSAPSDFISMEETEDRLIK